MSGGSEPTRVGGFRFPVERRIRKRGEYLRIQSAGRRVTTPSYVVLVMARPDDSTRLGITATRKLGGAVLRNRAKRVVREVFRLHPELFPKGADVVVIVRGQAHRLSFEEAVAELRAVAPLLVRRVSQMRASLAQGP